MKKLIAGNWKLNGNLADNKALIDGIANLLNDSPDILTKCDLLVCPPAIYIPSVNEIAKCKGVFVGAQDCTHHDHGAYTGEISAAMIKECGATHVILGHSERRQYQDESNTLISWKAAAAHDNGLTTIICVGESAKQREAGDENTVVAEQLKESIPESATAENIIIAYEPVWAIGTGKTASVDDVTKMHKFIKDQLSGLITSGEKVLILYGGSMKPENAQALLSTPNVDGGLIGGASLKADQFIAIANAAPEN